MLFFSNITPNLFDYQKEFLELQLFPLSSLASYLKHPLSTKTFSAEQNPERNREGLLNCRG